jgi:hypothetical protein
MAVTDSWKPRWPGDQGDAFEPYQQLIEQYLHSTVAYHARWAPISLAVRANENDRPEKLFNRAGRPLVLDAELFFTVLF